jgi:ribosomal protein S18 acetylase RimI-like enzyme
VICAPGTAGAALLRAAEPSEATAVQAVMEASSAIDEPASWPRGGWSVAAWATHTRVLECDDRIVGLVAVRAEAAPDGAMPARVGLELSARQPANAVALVKAGLDLVSDAGGNRARLFVPSTAAWIHAAAREAGFEPVRTVAHMLMPAEVPTPAARSVPGLALRTIRTGEDEHVLAALNRAWTGTWNFVSITIEMLAEDLHGQRGGMLLGVEADNPDHIVATCHAVFDPSAHNPDGNPRAWISNLTVDPDFRGRGVARYMLAAGIENLRSRGATSITLGVDASDPAPFGLYKSVGFEIASSQDAWDKALA